MKHTRHLLFALLTLVWTASQAAALPGRAEVKKVTGSATVTNAKGVTSPLAAGAVLGTGDTVTTTPKSTVDLWLGLNGDALRVEADSTLKFDVLDIVNVSERVVTTLLNVSKGEVTGNIITKLAKGSSYQVKTPKGTANITGTVYRFNASTGQLTVASGTVIMSYTDASGATKSVTVQAGQQVTVKAGVATVAPAPRGEITALNVIASVMAFFGKTTVGDVVANTATTTDISNPLVNSVSSK